MATKSRGGTCSSARISGLSGQKWARHFRIYTRLAVRMHWLSSNERAYWTCGFIDKRSASFFASDVSI